MSDDKEQQLNNLERDSDSGDAGLYPAPEESTVVHPVQDSLDSNISSRHTNFALDISKHTLPPTKHLSKKIGAVPPLGLKILSKARWNNDVTDHISSLSTSIVQNLETTSFDWNPATRIFLNQERPGITHRSQDISIHPTVAQPYNSVYSSSTPPLALPPTSDIAISSPYSSESRSPTPERHPKVESHSPSTNLSFENMLQSKGILPSEPPSRREVIPLPSNESTPVQRHNIAPDIDSKVHTSDALPSDRDLSPQHHRTEEGTVHRASIQDPPHSKPEMVGHQERTPATNTESISHYEPTTQAPQSSTSPMSKNSIPHDIPEEPEETVLPQSVEGQQTIHSPRAEVINPSKQEESPIKNIASISKNTSPEKPDQPKVMSRVSPEYPSILSRRPTIRRIEPPTMPESSRQEETPYSKTPISKSMDFPLSIPSPSQKKPQVEESHDAPQHSELTTQLSHEDQQSAIQRITSKEAPDVIHSDRAIESTPKVIVEESSVPSITKRNVELEQSPPANLSAAIHRKYHSKEIPSLLDIREPLSLIRPPIEIEPETRSTFYSEGIPSVATSDIQGLQIMGNDKPKDTQAMSVQRIADTPIHSKGERIQRIATEASGPIQSAHSTPSRFYEPLEMVLPSIREIPHRESGTPDIALAPIQRTPTHSSTTEVSQHGEGDSSEGNIEALAREVYVIIRRRLAVEKERAGCR